MRVFVLRIVGLCLVCLVTVVPTLAQTQSWDYRARERSQSLASAGVTYLTKGSIDQAIASLLEATRSDPADYLPYALLGLALDIKERHSEGLDALHHAYKLAPKVSETVLSIGITHYLMHNYDKAINAWRKALELSPNLCHVYANLGYSYLRQADLEHAGECFGRLTSCYPNSQVAYQGLATVNYFKGDFASAREAAEQAQTIWPYQPNLLILAKLDVLQGDKSRAEKRIAELIKRTRKPWIQRTMTAIGYPIQHDFAWDPYLADNYDNAYLLKARTLNWTKEVSRTRSLSRQGKATEAVERGKRSLASHPKDYYILHELGLLQLSDGQYSDASEKFREALGVCPDCHVDLLHLARALSADGKAAEASAQVRQFQRWHPKERLSPMFLDIARVDPGLAEINQSSAEGPQTSAEVKSSPEAGF
ncbi:MAG: tetratricopeptide repeat protein [Candidatus Melainabacteria bacterium]|nr:tetratricopeptide repeat protein [Candidatus Melainabacteria bacterium]